MKKTKFVISAVLALCCVAGAAGCSSDEYASLPRYELPNYHGETVDEFGDSVYNQEVFYRNDYKLSGADPFVLDDTARSGYYYLYRTENSMDAARSKDLMNWEPVGGTLNIREGYNEISRATWTSVWAPEVVYDEENERYIMYFSASPDPDTSVTGKYEGDGIYLMYAAVSDSPEGPFNMVDFTDPESVGEENVHTYNREDYPHYYAKYAFFDPTIYGTWHEENADIVTSLTTRGGYYGTIDPHPFVTTDEDGNEVKYLLWVDNTSSNRVMGVEMENWLKPKWDTLTVLAVPRYYTVEDFINEVRNGVAAEYVSYESANNGVNEGPEMVERNGKYYLTLSIEAYDQAPYSVIQLVADSPLGPFRKLTEAENGHLLSNDSGNNEEVSGPGHHSFVTMGGKLYIVYHRHNNPAAPSAARNMAIDEVVWVTTEDENGNELDVMYVNGPTVSEQPALEGAPGVEYTNIADEAEVSVSGALADGSSSSFLNDGLLSIYRNASYGFVSEYVKESEITGTTSFEFSFETARTVRAVMVYNSKMFENAFRSFTLEMICEDENGVDYVRYIDEVPFDSERYARMLELDGSFIYITPGSAAYAEFYEHTVKKLRITIDVPEGQELVGISEIRILGK